MLTRYQWAAINNHYALCKYLVEKGVDVNAKGGEAVATAAMWAAQRCNYYVVHLLLQSGADPLLKDAQGYNILHLATFDGNVFLLVLLLHQNIPIDVPDLQGHTSLMWAAYKGYPACVDLFLRWGASVSETDENGFTALHWSIVKGSYPCIEKLIEYGSDRFAETSDHKTPSIVADETKTVGIWERALDDCGYGSDGNLAKLPLPYMSFVRQPDFLNRFFFLFPFLQIFVVLYMFSSMVIYAAIPFGLLVAYTLQWAAKRTLHYAPAGVRDLHRTVIDKSSKCTKAFTNFLMQPYLAGVFAASCFWVGVRWITTILPSRRS